jgi:hypothetical protein
MDALHQALHLMRGADGPRYAYHKPTPEQIAAAETALGQKLPPSYVKFLKTWDGCAIDYWEVLVLDESLDEEGVAGILDTNLGERAFGLPEHLIAFHPDGHGGYLCFDARARDAHGECRIVAWAHDMSAEENIAAIGGAEGEHGESFDAWLLGEVQEQVGEELS